MNTFLGICGYCGKEVFDTLIEYEGKPMCSRCEAKKDQVHRAVDQFKKKENDRRIENGN